MDLSISSLTDVGVLVAHDVVDELLYRLEVGLGDALWGVQHEHQVHQGRVARCNNQTIAVAIGTV